MRSHLAALAILLATATATPSHAELSADSKYARDCLVAASRTHQVPAILLLLLLRVEGGRLGAVSQNSNDTVDIGPMQVNSTWVHKMAQRWRASDQAAYRALRDNFCANVEAGAWILKAGLDEAGGDFWQGVSYYHSHSPDHQRRYLGLIWQQIVSLGLDAGRHHAAATPPPPAPAEAAR